MMVFKRHAGSPSLLVVAWLIWLCISAHGQSQSGAYREIYSGITGSTIADLTGHSSFPNAPNSDDVIDGYFETPSNAAENYGQRLRALITAPVSGQYTFWIASDDAGQLWLSTNDTATGRQLIASVTSWAAARQWTKEPGQASAPITLAAGQRYYIEALMKEGTGGDNLAVRWLMPTGWENAGNTNLPIPATRLTPFGLTAPVFNQHPANTIVVEGGQATFSVKLARMAGATLQWQRNGQPIPGATDTTYVTPPVALTENGVIYRCLASNSLGVTLSAGAVLTVNRDATPPTVLSAGSLGDPETLIVSFSEEVETISALNAGNYTIERTNGSGATVLSAAWGPDQRTVLLRTTALAPTGTYLLKVANVRDRAATPNPVPPGSQVAFTLTPTPLPMSMHKPPREALGPSSRRGPLVISEVMYHPPGRPDGKELEFIEIYNSQPWFEELSGYRITGAIEYTFPSNYVLAARSFALIAKAPADVASVYARSGMLGPWSGSLENSSGTLQLRNAQGAILFEMDYNTASPYPVSPDGGGHSLVLARPSLGEADPRAWAASELVGGSPGAHEPSLFDPFAAIQINEYFARGELPQSDFIELFNYSTTAVNLAGCSLSDSPETNKYIFPANSIIGPNGFVVLHEADLGFALSASGEEIFLRNPSGTRVIDSVRFGAQQNGVSAGRFPDGAQRFSRLAWPTPGSNNAPVRSEPVVINEVMYHPLSELSEDEFIELHNLSTNAVDLGGWRLRDAIEFTLPTGTMLPAGGYLVVGRNAARLRATHPGLTPLNCVGDWQGTLRDSTERITLTMPEPIIGTNSSGKITTNTIHVAVDEVTYRDGGRWADGDGSSLELRDPRADRREAPSWGDSDESTRSSWVTVEATGVLTNGWSGAYQLHITLLGAGECLVDNVEVIGPSGANLINNGTFESGAAGWVFQGNHNDTTVTSAAGYNSANGLHLRATGRGDNGANRVRTELATTLAGGNTVTIRAKARWLKGNPNLVLRIRGNWMEALAFTLDARNLGTPGRSNSIAVTNAGPAIADVTHWPALPTTGQPVRVTARVTEPDGLATLMLRYRLDPGTNLVSVPMANHGAGLFSGVIPGQAASVLGAFHIAGVDRFGAASRFPAETRSAPAPGTTGSDLTEPECLVMWGDTSSPGTLGTYRFWITATNIGRWSTEERMSNKPRDVTFIYNGTRVVYNAGAWFHGSPYHSPSYNSPVGNSCDYDLVFPSDDRLLGETEINLFRPGNGGGDNTGQAEIHAYWWGNQFGLPFLYNRPVFVIVNGMHRRQSVANIIYDAQQPNGDFIQQWFPDDADGDLHKIQLGFEFGDEAYGSSEQGFATVGANFNRYLTTGGAFFRPRYRQTLPRRAAAAFEQVDYTNIYTLVNAVLTNAPLGSAAYTTTLTNITDVHHWYKVHVAQHLYDNTDSFSWGGGQNAFMYKPTQAPWKLLLWDVDFAFGGPGTNAALFTIGGADHGPRNDHPPFRRIYWQYLIEAAEGFMTQARSFPILDARYTGLINSGATVSAPTSIKSFIDTKRNVVLSQIGTVPSPFAITSGNGADFTAASNLVTLSGVAPLGVRTIEINGVAYTPTWSSITNWTISLALGAGSNRVVVVGKDRFGAVVSNATAAVNVTVQTPPAPPEGNVVFNEIMFAPREGGADYIELYNRSTTTSYDLSRWRIDGVDYTFPDGTLLLPRQYLVVADDRFAFTNTHGAQTELYDVFAESLRREGETVTLLRTNADQSITIIDQVRYDGAAPWTAAAVDTGSSLQLIDAAQDNSRPGNWQTRYAPAVFSEPVSTPARTNEGWRLVSLTGTYGIDARILLYLDGAGSLLLDDISLVSGTQAEVGSNWIRNGGFELPLETNIWALGTNMRNSFVTSENVRSGNGALQLMQTSAGSPSILLRDLVHYVSPRPTNGHVCTLSFWYYATNTTATNFTVRVVASGGLTVNTNIRVLVIPSNYIPAQVISPEIVLATPGGSNSFNATLPPFPSIWINEVHAGGPGSLADASGEHEPWIELYNAGTNSVSLDGLYLGSHATNLAQWAFPAGTAIAPRSFAIFYLDGESAESTASEWHASFRLAPHGLVALTRLWNGTTQTLDYVTAPTSTTFSFGSYPDGQPFHRQDFQYPTPGTTNNGVPPPVRVVINEWMADNAGTTADPADGDFDDWFELYNPGSNSVSLGGYFLTDTLSTPFKYQIPPGYTIPPNGFLLVWADSETSQNNSSRTDLHVNFSLAKGGESIGLFTPSGVAVDTVTFSAQTTDLAMGRYPDGSPSIFFLTNATPNSRNLFPEPNSSPQIKAIPAQFVVEGAVISVTPEATDSDYPAQTLSWTLLSTAPANSAFDPGTGTFAWLPGELDGGSTVAISLRVSDDGSPSLSATQTFHIVVAETNSAPVFSAPGALSVAQLEPLRFTVLATDPDLPAQNLTFSLDPGALEGASIDLLTGEFYWAPDHLHAPGDYPVTIRVTDDGSPPKSDAAQLIITVTAPPDLRLAPVTWSNGVIHLSWPARPGRRYQVEAREALTAAPWLPVGPEFQATGPTLEYSETVNTTTQRFYRVSER